MPDPHDLSFWKGCVDFFTFPSPQRPVTKKEDFAVLITHDPYRASQMQFVQIVIFFNFPVTFLVSAAVP